MSEETQTGTGFTPPADTKPARKKANPAKGKAAKAAQGLLDALSFLEPATDDETKHGEFVRFSNNFAVVFNGSIAMGHPIQEELTLCPHLARLKHAINKAGAQISMTKTDNGRLSVSGGSLRAVVPCLPMESYPPVMPDPNIAVVDDRIKEGFKAVTMLAKEDADRVVEASILVRANSMVGTNGQLMLEFWHGIDLPPGLAIPQKAAKIIAKANLPLTGFGFDWGRSVTFYFANGAWIKSQLYAEEWPDVDAILNTVSYPVDVPAKLWEGLDAIEKFSEDGGVHFDTDKLRSTFAHVEGTTEDQLIYGATYDVPGLQGRHSFTAKLLKLSQAAAAQMDYTTHSDRAVMFNNAANLRGVLMKRIG